MRRLTLLLVMALAVAAPASAEQVSIDEFRTEFFLRSAATTTCAEAYATLPVCTGESISDAPEPTQEQPELRW